MQKLILKNHIEKSKIDALILFLKSWDIEAELVPSIESKIIKKELTLSVGIWKDYNIDAITLRQKAWNRSK
jgi:hypothetical protein